MQLFLLRELLFCSLLFEEVEEEVDLLVVWLFEEVKEEVGLWVVWWFEEVEEELGLSLV